jgi:hypothetical protein
MIIIKFFKKNFVAINEKEENKNKTSCGNK